MKPFNSLPEKGLAAKVDGQWWLLESQTDYAKAILLRRERVSFYQNGVLHREAGAAIIRADGAQLWYQNGKLHRADGPAIIWADGHEFNERRHSAVDELDYGHHRIHGLRRFAR